MFERVLVANRGEIAVRVMRACEELGIETVAVYSDADAEGEHVRYADEAYNVGPARAAESYLDHDAILNVAEEAEADAIHPGYGFLAENARFARKVEQTDGVTWVGPSADAMEELGEKTRARRAMSNAEVPIVPGTTEPVVESEEVVAFGDEYGYPVVIKAEGGGGGRGMKVVEGPEAVADQLESAKREGEAYFDNDSVYLERYLKNPRHIEVQILADEHGNVRHLGERDCSLQRRHQKVIEEGPSAALSDELREEIGDAARRGVDAVGYTNAGTVEFIVEEDPEREAGEVLGPETNYYFLEVNTRIQVEHTVTEELTGIDIVKWQLRIADGQEIEFSQDEVELDGHAMEFRINAENAAKEFQPATGGKLATYDPPSGIGVRMDDALRQGDSLVTDYDSMIAKLIVHGGDREECIARSLRAFREYDLEGVVTTIPFHRLMLTDEAFVAGTHTTKYLDEEIDLDAVEDAQNRWGSDATGGTAGNGRTASGQSLILEIDGRRFDVRVTDPGNTAIAGGSTAGAGGGDSGTDESAAAESAVGGDGQRVTAEMQGTVLDVEVDVGDKVAAGDVLLVLEAMKMENDIVADLAGTVSAVQVNAGDSVSMGDTLLVLE